MVRYWNEKRWVPNPTYGQQTATVGTVNTGTHHHPKMRHVQQKKQRKKTVLAKSMAHNIYVHQKHINISEKQNIKT